ncbi:DUF1254 domain-containing protein [Catellatospora sp. KI3]|uniref:DUF1254 domain-containing protein n=1 Tax=Catellatospora sp. KI3 TaxID=3041620 RepID=UPI00248217C8|nr:DUF1254 domain-containing protein [Catellatospora sp. KI3]MDI1463476.1 DUF1254 domain-containing protein [Catellatospora sp. KI3]
MSDGREATDTQTSTAAGVRMHTGYAQTLARMAYLWGWPIVNMINRRAAITRAPEPGRLNGVLPAAPRGRLAMLNDYIDSAETFVTCPNQDVVYGLGYFSLDEEPVVLQVPDFGDRFWVYALYDARTDQFGQLGKPYATPPGLYLLAGPAWNGQAPDGIQAVIRSSTSLAAVIPRVFLDDTPQDRAAIQPLINQIGCYPLTEYDGHPQTTDWSNVPTIPGPAADGHGETKWVLPDRFFEQLAQALDEAPPLPGEQALFGQFRLLLDAAAEDTDLAKTLVETAEQAEQELIAPFFRWEHNGRPAGNGWNRSTNNAVWGLDYFDRTGTAKSNMFDNRPAETQYFYTDYDADGAQLDGAHTYEITFPAGQEPPVDGFWSLTLYNDQHLFHPNELDRYSLGTKNKTLSRGADGSLTLTAGGTAPSSDRVANWLPAPQATFSLYLRAYWGRQPILDGTWQPPAVRRTSG